MYRVLTSQQEQHTHGDPLAPGGQRIVTSWVVTVASRDGVERRLEFLTQPTDQEILDHLPSGRPLTPVSKLGWERVLEDTYETWLRWKTTRLEAQARALAANVIAALTAREDLAWTDYASAVNSWRTAS